MGITDAEELAFRLLSLFFCYFWPIPFKWDYAKSKIILNTSIIRNIPFVIMQLVLASYAWASFLMTIYFGKTRTEKGFPRINHIVHVGAWAIMTIFTISTYMATKRRHVLTSVINQVLEITDQVQKEWNGRTGERSFQFGTNLPLIGVPFFCGLAVLIPIACSYADVDGAYYLVDLVLPQPEYRSRTNIWFALAFRFILNFFVSSEMVRLGVFGVSVVLIAIDRATKSGKIIMKYCRDVDRFAILYVQGTILFKKVEDLAVQLVYIVMTGAFWLTVIFCWVCVKCNVSSITLPVYIVFGMGSVILLVGHLVLLSMMCTGLSMSVHIVKLEQLRAQFGLAKVRSWKNRIILKRLKAIMPIRLKYGRFWYIDKDFASEYFWLLNLRTFDAILLIDI